MLLHRRPCCLLLSLLAACALSAPPADATLATAATRDELEDQAQAALLRARAATGADLLPAQLEATALLFAAADRRLQVATVAWLDANPAATRSEVLAADDQVADDVRTGILSLCTAGLELAEAAHAAHQDSGPAALHTGLHLSLIAWANGPARSLFAGYGPRLVAAIDAALALDRALDGGAPLRLAGRFRGRAPWPYGDLPLARQLLGEAVGLRSVPVNHLFFGDALAAAGELPAARAQWQLAVTAPFDATTRWSADLLRTLAQRRLAAPE